MAIPMRAALLALTSLVLAGGPATAQPPGLSPPGGHAPPQHAVPPVPYSLASPLPTLPPPSRNAPIEPTFGFGVGNGRFTAQVGADGSIRFDDDHGGFWAGADPVVGLIALVTFDTTDQAMRAARQDPHLVEKLRLMDETRDQRMAMRRLHNEVVMQRALDDLPRYLDAVWRQRRWSPEVRRRVLFALWDEAAEEGDGNPLVVAGGAEARYLIEEFIAYRIPPGSGHDFADRELSWLNRIRQSRQTFAPYAAAAGRRAHDAEQAAIRDASGRLAVAVRSL